MITFFFLAYFMVAFAEPQQFKLWEIEPVIKKLEQLTNITLNRDKLSINNFHDLEDVINKKGASVKIKRVGSSRSYGINLVKDFDDEVLIIPVPGSSLWNKGVTTYVSVNAIDGKEVKNKSVTDLINKLRKSKQTIITYFHRGSPKKIILKKKIQSFENLHIIRNHSTLIIRINRFLEGRTFDSFLEKINRYNLKKINHVIVDLRYNTGGNIDVAMSIAAYFVDHPVIAGYLKMYNGDVIPIIATPENISGLQKNPLSILMSRFTASAAEMFIRAMYHKKQFHSYGEKTYGKCKTQTKAMATRNLAVIYTNGDILDSNKKGCDSLNISSKMSLFPNRKIALKELFSLDVYKKINLH